MPYFRQPNYWILLFCFLLTALLFRAAAELTAPSVSPVPSKSQQQRVEVQKQELGNAVSGMIGIDETRGDSVYVMVK